MNKLRSIRSLVATLALTAASGALAGCGGAGNELRLFSTEWRDDQGKSIGEVEARLRSAKPAANTDLVVAVAGQRADKLVGVSLSTGATWAFGHALDARPIIAGAVVVGSGGGELFALDATSGKRLWARPSGGAALLGAGDDGNVTAVTVARGTGSAILVVGRDGSVKQQIESERPIGDPAVVGGVVFVPWAGQYVSAIDGASGDEIGRVTLRDKVSRAVVVDGTLYFGENAFVRFDDRISFASRGQANRVVLPSRELPGTPRLLSSGEEKLPPVANARDRDRLFARPSSADGPLSIDANRFYASYFRLVLGFDAKDGHLAWVHTHDADYLGGDAVNGGVVLCDDRGKIVVLDARTGQVALEQSFGEPIHSCVAHTDDFRAPAVSAQAPSLGEQITKAVENREASLVTAQRLLLRELSTLSDESATKTLIDIASDERAAPVLVADARAGIAARRNGADVMLASLSRHYDFLRDVLRPPPVGPLADALAAMKETRAAPLLAAHVLDPANSDEDVRRAAVALTTLATKSELGELQQFFGNYRANAASEDVATAVANVGAAIVRLDPVAGRALVDAALKDEMTVPFAKARLDALLTAMPKEGAASPESKGGAPARPSTKPSPADAKAPVNDAGAPKPEDKAWGPLAPK